MDTKETRRTEGPWARRVLFGATVLSGLFFIGDALFDYIPEETVPHPIAEVVGGVALIGLAVAGNHALKSYELSE